MPPRVAVVTFHSTRVSKARIVKRHLRQLQRQALADYIFVSYSFSKGGKLDSHDLASVLDSRVKKFLVFATSRPTDLFTHHRRCLANKPRENCFIIPVEL